MKNDSQGLNESGDKEKDYFQEESQTGMNDGLEP
jgi:hypothetical protein